MLDVGSLPLPGPLGVVPVLVGPLQTLLMLLPYLLVMLGGLIVSLFKPSTAWKLIKLMWRQKLPVGGAAGFCVLAWWGWGELVPAHGGTATVEGDSQHLLYRGGPERRGWVPGHGDPVQGGRVWQQAELAKALYPAPTVCGDHVFVGTSAVDAYTGSDGFGMLACLDAHTGEVIWKYDQGKLRAIFSSPAVTERYVVCGEGLHFVKDARVLCLDRASGALVWSFQTHEHVEASPCIHHDKVYVGAGMDGYYCLALKGDGAGGPLVLWHKTKEDGFVDCESSPVVHDGRVYVGLGIGGEAVCCLDADTGRELWRLKTPAPVFAPLAVAGNKLYIGMGHGNYIKTAEQFGKPPEGQLWCIDLEAAKSKAPEGPLWSYATGRVVLTAPAVAHGKVYFGSTDGVFHCVDATDGKPLKTWNAQSVIATSPAVGEKHVYFATMNGLLYGLDAETLKPVWESALFTARPEENHFFFSSPTLAHGHVYIGTANDGLLCLGQPGAPPESEWAGRLGGPGRSGRADTSPMGESSELAWSYDGGSTFEFTAPPAYFEACVYAPVKTDRGHALTQLVLNAKPAEAPAAGWAVALKSAVTAAPAAKRGTIWFVEGAAGESERRLRALDLKSGTERWSVPVAPQASGELTLCGERLFVAGRERGLTAYGLEDAAPLWHADPGACIGAPACHEGRVAVALREPAGLALLDAETGFLLWQKALSAVPVTGPIFDEDRIVVGLKDGIAAFQAFDGAPLWHSEAGADAAAPLVLERGCLAAVDAQGELTLLDAASGNPIKTVSGALPGIAPILAAEGLFYMSRAGIMHTTLDASRERKGWLRFSRTKMGTVRCGAIVAGSHVYIGTDKGLVCAGPRGP